MRIKATIFVKLICCLAIPTVLFFILIHVYEKKSSIHQERSITRGVNETNEISPISNTDLVVPLLTKYRILCWVLTNPPNLMKKTIYIKWTWGPLCDITLYMSSTEDLEFPTIGLNITAKESKSFNSIKVRRAWLYIYEHYLDQADFFMKADDDTYVVVNNLRAYLATKDPNVAEFYGRRFQLPKKHVTYMSGGGGLVLTREALRVLIENVLAQNTSCIPNGMGEDWKICRCLQLAGAMPVDTRDEKGRERFHSFNLGTHLSGKYPAWFFKYDLDGAIMGDECCSEYPISFHYVKGDALLTIHYLMHHIKLAQIPNVKQ